MTDLGSNKQSKIDGCQDLGDVVRSVHRNISKFYLKRQDRTAQTQAPLHDGNTSLPCGVSEAH